MTPYMHYRFVKLNHLGHQGGLAKQVSGKILCTRVSNRKRESQEITSFARIGQIFAELGGENQTFSGQAEGRVAARAFGQVGGVADTVVSQDDDRELLFRKPDCILVA